MTPHPKEHNLDQNLCLCQNLYYTVRSPYHNFEFRRRLDNQGHKTQCEKHLACWLILQPGLNINIRNPGNGKRNKQWNIYKTLLSGIFPEIEVRLKVLHCAEWIVDLPGWESWSLSALSALLQSQMQETQPWRQCIACIATHTRSNKKPWGNKCMITLFLWGYFCSPARFYLSLRCTKVPCHKLVVLALFHTPTLPHWCASLSKILAIARECRCHKSPQVPQVLENMQKFHIFIIVLKRRARSVHTTLTEDGLTCLPVLASS